jgi:hypothetical protein
MVCVWTTEASTAFLKEKLESCRSGHGASDDIATKYEISAQC